MEKPGFYAHALSFLYYFNKGEKQVTLKTTDYKKLNNYSIAAPSVVCSIEYKDCVKGKLLLWCNCLSLKKMWVRGELMQDLLRACTSNLADF